MLNQQFTAISNKIPTGKQFQIIPTTIINIKSTDLYNKFKISYILDTGVEISSAFALPYR